MNTPRGGNPATQPKEIATMKMIAQMRYEQDMAELAERDKEATAAWGWDRDTHERDADRRYHDAREYYAERDAEQEDD